MFENLSVQISESLAAEGQSENNHATSETESLYVPTLD